MTIFFITLDGATKMPDLSDPSLVLKAYNIELSGDQLFVSGMRETLDSNERMHVVLSKQDSEESYYASFMRDTGNAGKVSV